MPPEIVVVYDHPRWEEKVIISALQDIGARVRLLHLPSEDIPLYGEAHGTALQRSLSLYNALSSTFALEALGYNVLNHSHTLAICGNKLWTLSRLARAGIPVPRTRIAFSPESAVRAAEEIGYPVVTKPLLGSWGRMVARARDRESLRGLVEYMENSTIPYRRVHLVQEYVEKPGRDIRIFTIGESAVAAIYRISGDWVTNTSRGARAEPARIDPELEDIAARTAKALGYGFLGIDVFEDPERGYLVNEVNGVPEFKNTVMVTGIPIHKHLAEYVYKYAKA